MFLILLLVSISSLNPSCDGAKILGLFAHYGISHWNVHEPLLKGLADRGHSLVVVSPFEPRVSLKCSNCTTRHINTRRVTPQHDVGFVGFEQLESSDIRGTWGRMKKMLAMAEALEDVLGLKEVQELIGQNFDLVIIEMFNTDIYYGLAHKIGRPIVGITCHSIMSWHSDSMGNPYDVSYILNVASSAHLPMGFFDRVLNTVETTMALALYRSMGGPRFQAVAETHLGPLPDLTSIMAETSLILVNAHFSVTGPLPHMPNVIEVGGINVGPTRPLPNNLQEIMDNASGVIYFSLGSATKGTMSEEKRHAFLRAFSELSDRVILWKWDGQKMEDAPRHVHTLTWLPQRDILAHDKVDLFISHCGALSMNEAMAEGVPVLCIPLFGDQTYNAQLLKVKGVSKTLDYRTDIHYLKIKRVIDDMLDKTFKQAARTVAAAYNDRPMSPLDTAIYWVEYVIRYKGATHLKSPARHMSWVTYRNLDVWAFLTLSVVIACLLTRALFKALWLCVGFNRKLKLN